MSRLDATRLGIQDDIGLASDQNEDAGCDGK